MATAAVLATALTTHAAKARGLFVSGVDVLYEPSAPGSMGYAVPIESVQVHEDGPGGVSSLSFTIEDYALRVELTDGAEVRFEDLVRGVPVFRGWVQHWDETPRPAGVGRDFKVIARGAESLLDWAVLPVAFDTNLIAIGQPHVLVQALVAAAIGTGPLRAFAGGGVAGSDQPTPISSVVFSANDEVVVPAGTTLREAIRRVLVSAVSSFGARWAVTVDPWFGLRTWIVGVQPSDYTSPFIVNRANQPNPVAEPLELGYDSTTIRRVLVLGAPGVSAIVEDGSGIPGGTAVLSDAALTTVDAAVTAGQAYLAQYQANVRGSMSFEDFDLATTGFGGLHPGSTATITDDNLGLTGGGTFLVTAVDRTFNPSGRENLVVWLGSPPPEVTRLLRQLTAGVQV